MRTRGQFLFLSSVLACGGDDQSTAATVTTLMTGTSVSGDVTEGTNPSSDTIPTGPGESEASGDSGSTNDMGEDLGSAPAPGAPVFLSLQTNVSKITAGESVIFTAVLTDPEGVDDIVGGTLSDLTGMIGYGPFVAAGQEGTYSIELSWDAIHQTEPIQFEDMDLMRMFRAEFYDQAANKVSKDVDLTLTCIEGSACDGVCTDLMSTALHCGVCGKSCDSGCNGGQCAPKWGECLIMTSGFDTCDEYCSSIGETCAENSCGNNRTVRGFNQPMYCESETLSTSFTEPCDTVQTWGQGRLVIQCCCTDTK